MKQILMTVFSILTLTSIAQTDEVLNFDGTNDYVNLDQIASSMDKAGNRWSIELETKYDQDIMGPQDYGVLFGVNTANGDNKFLIRAAGTWDSNYANEGIVVYINENGTTNQYLHGTIPVGDDICHLISVTYDNGQISLYVDGVLDQTANHTFSFASDDRYSLGQEYDLGSITSNFFTGNIDELRIWGKVLDQNTEIIPRMTTQLSGTEPWLLAYFDFDNNMGGTTLSNYFVSGGDGILNNFALTGSTSNWLIDPCDCSDSTNTALHFDRSNSDYVNLNSIAGDMALLTQFTLEFWVEFTGPQSTQYDVIFSANTSTGGNRFVIRGGGAVDPNQNAIVIYNRNATDGSTEYLAGTTTVDDGDCHHVAVTYDQTTSRCMIYIDGVLDVTGILDLDFTATDQFSLGQEYDNANSSDHFDGSIDDIRIWNILRTQADIEDDMFSNLNGTEPGLQHFYNCDQGIPSGDNSPTGTNQTQLIDLVAGDNGTLQNFVLNSSISNFVQTSCVCFQNPLGIGMIANNNFPIAPKTSQKTAINAAANGELITYIRNEKLIISSDHSWENASAMIYDLNGKLVWTNQIQDGYTTELDISTLSRGMFIIQVSTPTKIYKSKFIK